MSSAAEVTDDGGVVEHQQLGRPARRCSGPNTPSAAVPKVQVQKETQPCPPRHQQGLRDDPRLARSPPPGDQRREGKGLIPVLRSQIQMRSSSPELMTQEVVQTNEVTSPRALYGARQLTADHILTAVTWGGGHASPLYCSRPRGLFISTVKKSREPFSRAATILRRKHKAAHTELSQSAVACVPAAEPLSGVSEAEASPPLGLLWSGTPEGGEDEAEVAEGYVEEEGGSCSIPPKSKPSRGGVQRWEGGGVQRWDGGWEAKLVSMSGVRSGWSVNRVGREGAERRLRGKPSSSESPSLRGGRSPNTQTLRLRPHRPSRPADPRSHCCCCCAST
ncbi:hypothetical protein F7725_017926 [Dissostichus mawsoni]|uniref:Uncharacterized protein n=1 Tax=Dissostichus mawsoni TaxID=36200 RepID=A0A7J5XRL9_DISMA|nr:hypothetical protein F7725_017926 [Dissostichus mawsoni]